VALNVIDAYRRPEGGVEIVGEQGMGEKLDHLLELVMCSLMGFG